LQVVPDDDRGSDGVFDATKLLSSPFPPFSPIIKFTNCWIGNDDDSVPNVRPIKARPGVLLAKEEEGENIGV